MQQLIGPAALRLGRQATINLLCLAVAPSALTIFGGARTFELINRFCYNGYIFAFVALTTEPMLKAAHRATGLAHFLVGRLCFPAVVGAFVLEGAMVRHLQLDSHVAVHVFALAFIATINA